MFANFIDMNKKESNSSVHFHDSPSSSFFLVPFIYNSAISNHTILGLEVTEWSMEC